VEVDSRFSGFRYSSFIRLIFAAYPQVEVDSPYWSAAPTVDLVLDPGPGSDNKGKNKASRDVLASINLPGGDAEPGNHFLMGVNAGDPGTYPCRVFMFPLHAAVPDFRVYEVEAEVSERRFD
jgi:hypothetical protein